MSDQKKISIIPSLRNLIVVKDDDRFEYLTMLSLVSILNI